MERSVSVVAVLVVAVMQAQYLPSQAQLTSSYQGHGFLLRYPPNWRVQEGDRNVLIAPSEAHKRSTTGEDWLTHGLFAGVLSSKVTELERASEAVFEIIRASNPNVVKTGLHESIRLDGRDALIAEYANNAANSPRPESGLVTVVEGDTTVAYVVLFCPATEKSTFFPLFHEIISSFRFDRTAKFRTLNPPNGDFIISVPPGWGFEGNNFENPITVTPVVGGGPSATIWAMIWVTGLAEDMLAPDILQRARSSLNACGPIAQVMSVHTSRWNTGDTLGLILAYLNRNGQPAQLVSSTMLSAPESMEATVRSATRGVPTEARLIFSMEYAPSPSYTPIVAMAHQQCPRISMLPAWESFAFLTSCNAPAGTLVKWEPICTAIFASFHPRANWLVAYAQQFTEQMKANAVQVNQITASIRHIGEMQLQNQIDWMARNWTTGLRAGDVLGGNIRLTDPQTGEQVLRPNVYDHYCKDSVGNVWGTNDAFILQPPDCAVVLK
jgi:hypothetical protein